MIGGARKVAAWEWLIPLLVLLPAAWALLPGGLPNTADGTVHFMRAAEMVHAWQDGVWMPRWSQHLGYGYGIPLFVYAPPLPYLLTAGLHRLGFGPEAAYKGMLLAGIVIAASGAYWMGRVLLGIVAGAVAAAAFLYAPIQLRELFVQGNAAQFLAWAFPPWAAWAVIQIYRHSAGPPRAAARPVGYAVALALALAGTLLSHNAAALIVMGMVAGLALLLAVATQSWRGLAWAAAGSALGLLLSAWFWGPALLEGKYVALDRIVASDFRPRFIALAELLAWPPQLDRGAINPYLPLSLGAAQVALALLGTAGWLALVLRPAPATPVAERRVLWGTGLFMTLFAAFCGFMATRWSEPVWTVLPFVDLFEWPFRWHGFTALGLSWLAGAAAAAPVAFVAAHIPPRMAAWVAAGTGAILVGLLLGAALVYLQPQKLQPGTRRISAAEVARFESRSAAVGSTSLGEFNPIWVAEPFFTSPLVDDLLAGRPVDRLPAALPAGVTGHALENGAHHQSYALDVAAPATVTLELLYFPGWQARANGVALTLAPAPVTGLLQVGLPAGEYTLDLIFGETPLRQVMDWVSSAAWAALIGLALVWGLRRSRGPSAEASGGSTFPVYAFTGIAAAVAAVLVLQIGFARAFRLESPPDRALPAQVELRADFGDRLRLLGIDPPPQTVAAGGPLTLVAYWRALESLDDDYAVFLHLDDPVSGATLATVDQSHPSEIPTSDWATGLYVRNPLRLVVPADTPPIQYVLRLGFYAADGELLEVAGRPGDVFDVARVWVTPATAPRPPDGPQARFGADVELLGATPDPENGALTLYWRTSAPLPADYSIFVHLLDETGQTVGQADGAPYANRYPTTAWRPQSVIEDRRELAASGADLGRVQRIAVGVYDPATGVRLSAVDGAGKPLPDDALILPWAAR
jgi:hypothetical protein